MEGFDHALQFWWKDLEETVSADKIKRLFEINESDIQGHPLFSGLFLELAEGEDLSIVDLPAQKPHCDSG